MGTHADLEQELGGPLAALDLLTEDEAADLLAMFGEAEQAETTALTESVDKVIGALPWPLRGPTKAIVFGNRFG